MTRCQLDDLEQRLKEDLGQFLLDIQTKRLVDVAAFQKVDGEAAELARVLKGQSLVPKTLLAELHFGAKVLRAEAPHLAGETGRLIDMADKIEMTFDSILKDESLDDRIPGVPRIV